jgi:hypothetical protein
MVFAPYTERGVENDTDKWASYSMSRQAFACDEARAGRELSVRKESLTLYYTDGTSYSQPTPTSPDSWRPITRYSMEYWEIIMVCWHDLTTLDHGGAG